MSGAYRHQINAHSSTDLANLSLSHFPISLIPTHAREIKREGRGKKEEDECVCTLKAKALKLITCIWVEHRRPALYYNVPVHGGIR